MSYIRYVKTSKGYKPKKQKSSFVTSQGVMPILFRNKLKRKK